MVKYCINSSIIFFKDKSFQHIDRTSQKIIWEGKLSFVATKYYESMLSKKLMITGLSDSGTLHGAVISLDNHYEVEER